MTRIKGGASAASRILAGAFDSRAARWLGGALVAQLAVAIGLELFDARRAEFVVPGPLLALDAGAVDTIGIGDGESQVTLTRDALGSSEWTVMGGDGPALPAAAAAIDAQLDRLAGLDGGLPVATSAAAREQLEVADDDHQRRVTLGSGGDTLATVFVGTSPGFRKAHVRLDGQDAIHAAELDVFELPATLDGWLDKALLAVPEPTRIAGEGWAIESAEDGWTLVEAAEDETLDDAAVQRLVDAVTGLRVTGTVESTGVPTGDATVLTVTGEGGGRTLTVRADDDAPTVRRDDIDADFMLAPTTVDALTADRDALLGTPDA